MKRGHLGSANNAQYLEIVFGVLGQHTLLVKASKRSFAQSTLEYLRHIISPGGVSTDPAKTNAMLKWPTPTSVTKLRGFFGLTGYYKKFVKGYGTLAKPLTVLLQKGQFEWTPSARQAFESLKQAMIRL